MANFSDIPTSLRVTTQLPLDHKRFSVSEAELSNLGDSSNLAFTYYDNLKVFCWAEKSEWVWREVKPGEENTGLVASDFTYPNGVVYPNPGYEGKKYNFFQVNTDSTQIIAGANTTVTGTGTDLDPYVISVSVPPVPPAELSPLKRADEGVGPGVFLRTRVPQPGFPIGLNAFDISYNSTPLELFWGVKGSHSFGQGDRINVNGSYSAGMGYNVGISGNYTFAFGKNLDAQSKETILIGNNNVSYGTGNIIIGKANRISGTGLFIVGNASTDRTNSGHSLTDYNIQPTKPVFVVGNGTIDNVTTEAITRSDAMIVRQNGSIEAPSLTIAGITAADPKVLITKEYLQANSGSAYKKYVALLNQSGTGVPVVAGGAPFENNIGTVTWTRTATGTYFATALGLITLNKTAVFVQDSSVVTQRVLAFSNNSGSQVAVQTYLNGVLADGILNNTSIEIRVYN